VRGERGQSTVEWVGLLLLVALLFAALAFIGLRLPGTAVAEAIASRVLCAVAFADSCGDEPALIAAYGDEVGRLVRRHMPTLAFEEGSRAVPVDWRRCRSTECADGPGEGMVTASDAGMPVTAFVHVVDRRPDSALYIQYWLYYPDSATFRGVPVAAEKGFHLDDWESVQVRIGADGEVDQRASSHHGYNYQRSIVNAGSDAGIDFVREATEDVGLREVNGWGPGTGLLEVSGGSHAGNVGGGDRGTRFIPGRRVHLVPLEPIAATARAEFAVSSPWQKRVWRDPEASGTE
jgi:hypothetical protein